MFHLRSVICATLLFGVSSTVAQTTSLNDSRIAHLVETAREIDLARAGMALSKATNSEVKSFAQQIKRDHTTGKAEALESFSQQGVKPEENELSQSLSEAGAERSKELAELSGSAFDKAYLQNEIAYNVFMIGVLEVTALPSIKNPVLKRLIQARLGTFKAHMKDAEAVLSNFK